MLQRVGRVLRVVLLLLGIVLLLWLPFSHYYMAAAETSQWPSGLSVYSTEGVIAGVISLESSALSVDFSVSLQPIKWDFARHSLWPSIGYAPASTVDVGDAVPFQISLPANVHLSLPLGLLAAVCLAWPVTSLLLARRRRQGRGFAVGGTREPRASPDYL